MHEQPHYYRVQQVGPCHRVGEVARCSSLAIGLLALCLNRNSNIGLNQGRSFPHFVLTESYAAISIHELGDTFVPHTFRKTALKHCQAH